MNLNTWHRHKRFIYYFSFLLFLTLLLWFAYYPYIPVEGDVFGCWYKYVQNLQQLNLAKALTEADASGRYPGLPLTMAIIQSLFQVNFLDALIIMRFLFAVLLSHSIWYALRIFYPGLNPYKNIWLILLFPTFLVNAFLNSQDSIKIFSFIYSIAFCVSYIRMKQNKYFWCCVFFSIYLGLSRSVELLPFYAFSAAYVYFELTSNLKDRVKTFIKIIAPSFVTILTLHVYGKRILGHWNASGRWGGSPQVWFDLAVSDVKGMQDFSFIEKSMYFLKLVFVVIANKMHYFFSEYFSSIGVVSMHDYLVFHKNFINGFLYSGALIVVFSLFIFLSVYFVFIRSKTQALAKALHIGTWTSVSFYIFGFNHFEARYWLIIFFGLWLGLISCFDRYRQLKYVYIPLLVLSLYLYANAFYYRKMAHLTTLRPAQTWEKDLQTVCKDTSKTTVILPWAYYHYSAFRYFIDLNCPRLDSKMYVSDNDLKMVSTLDRELYVADSELKKLTEEKGFVVFSDSYFQSAKIIGLSE